MSNKDIALRVESLSKQYRLGEVGTGTLSHDLNRWWHKVRGKEDPYRLVGDVNKKNEVGGDYVWALKDISFEVRKGEVLGIIGRNGAGKSTLLKVLSKITSPTTGEIGINGRVASLLEVGTGFHPELTGRENIFLNGAILGMTKSEIKAKLDEIVTFAGIAKYLNTPVKRYSSGMKVRLGFAVAAHLEPEILIVDEVLAVGDFDFQKKCIGKMKDVAEAGRTVLFVSHNMDSVRNLCNSGMLLVDGKSRYFSKIDDAIQEYLNNEEKKSTIYLNGVARKGSGEAILESIKLVHPKNGETSSFRSGESFQAEIFIKSHVDIDGVSISLGFNTEMNHFLTACKSDSIEKLFSLKRGLNRIIFKLERLPLSSGNYNFSIVLSKSSQPIDWVRNFGLLSVEKGDFYQTKVLPSFSKPGILIDYDWLQK